jgi:hypothetical protein
MKCRGSLTAVVWLVSALPCLAVDDAVVDSSGFVFKGTVRDVGRSTLMMLTPSPQTLVVRVDEVLKAPPSLGGILGRDVTVQPRSSSQLRKGQSAVFYTAGLFYGESLVLRELATLSGRVDLDALRAQIGRIEAEKADRALAARVSSAALVVSGTVTLVAALDEDSPNSEHDPELWRGELKLATVEKGGPPQAGTVSFLFAHSQDERWLLSPKPVASQSGVFLLQADETEAVLGLSGYSVLNRLDVQPLGQIETVRRLIGSVR